MKSCLVGEEVSSLGICRKDVAFKSFLACSYYYDGRSIMMFMLFGRGVKPVRG